MMDALALVRETTSRVCSQAKHVKINEKQLSSVASSIAAEIWKKLAPSPAAAAEPLPTPPKIGSVVSSDGYIECTSPRDNLWVQWDEETIHYSDPEREPELTAQYLLVLDSLNFCFWPFEGDGDTLPQLEYSFLATCLRDALLVRCPLSEK